MYTNHSFGPDETPTGGSKRFLELLLGMLHHGNTVHLFCSSFNAISPQPHLVFHTIYDFKIKYLPKAASLFLRNYKNIKKVIQGIDYDAFIVMDVPYAVQLSLLKIPKVVFMVRRDFIGCQKMSIEGSSYFIQKFKIGMAMWAEKKAIMTSKKILVQSKHDLDLLIQRHPFCKTELIHKSAIIPNNINPSWVTNHHIDAVQKTTPKRTDTELILCFIGHITKLKGLEVLLSTVKILTKQNYAIRLNVVGDGEQLHYLKNKYGNQANIAFWGFRNDAIHILKESDLLVVPSFYDSFPNTIMEALYMDVPVIGSKRGGIPEMLEYEELVFEPNVEALTNKIQEIMDKKLLEEYKKLCRERKQHFTFDWVKEIEECLLSK